MNIGPSRSWSGLANCNTPWLSALEGLKKYFGSELGSKTGIEDSFPGEVYLHTLRHQPVCAPIQWPDRRKGWLIAPHDPDDIMDVGQDNVSQEC